MSASNRGFRGKSSTFLDRKHADMPENVGNRKTFEEQRIPPDNVGNKIEQDPIATFIHDGLGNSTDEEPSHLRSGILTHLLGVRDRTHRRNNREPMRENYSSFSNSNKRMQRVVKRDPPSFASEPTESPKLFLADATKNEDYMASLTEEFAKLLHDKAGAPFSFSMRPVSDGGIDEKAESVGLSSIKSMITQILSNAEIDASVSLSHYRTSKHRFAVFFVNPKERDPAKNKDLISALRQVIKLHAPSALSAQVNILLVLANAQSVIEAHLFKIGAKKV